MTRALAQPWEWVSDLVATWNADGPRAMAERFWHRDMIWYEAVRFPDSGVRSGRDVCLERMAERLSLLGDVSMGLVDVERVGDRLLIELFVRGAGTDRAAPTELRDYFVGTIVDDQMFEMREYLEREEAVREIGAA